MSAPRWVGWFCPGDASAWERVCEGPTMEECSRLLIARTRNKTTALSRRFMTRGSYPETFLKKYDKAGA
jgi:hypothetical protein